MGIYSLSLLGSVSSLGGEESDICEAIFSTGPSPLRKQKIFAPCGDAIVGLVQAELPDIPLDFLHFASRTSQLALFLANKARAAVEEVRRKVPAQRIGVVLGSSTSGIVAAEDAFIERDSKSSFPSWYHYQQQEIGTVARVFADFLGIKGPTYTVSTACSSSAKAFVSARALIDADVCDVVLTGGIDSLCRLTVGGFSSLELISTEISNPFSKNRKGLNIGEGGAIFMLARNLDAPFALLGVGEVSDAYHISAPHPDGLGAAATIRAAISDAKLNLDQIGYINLHGTGTTLNDSMEAKAVAKEVGLHIPCSSTKPLTGHALGAAGALEAAFSCLALKHKKIPLHRFDGERDPELPEIALATRETNLELSLIHI